MAVISKSYSFKTKKEADVLKKAVKKLFKKKTPTMYDFRDKICKLCPHRCKDCIFCWHMFYKFKNTLVDYTAPLTVLKVLISGYYDSSYIPTFYFLKTNICSVCEKYDQACNSCNISIGSPCPSKYLAQMNSNESASGGISDEDMYDKFDQYDYANGRTYYGNYYQSGYLDNKDTNKCNKIGIEREDMYNELNRYEYENGGAYLNDYYISELDSINDTKPKLAINGEKMQKLANKLFGFVKHEHS